MNTFDTHQTGRGVEFKWREYDDGKSSLSVKFENKETPLNYSRTTQYFDMTVAELFAYLRASYEDQTRKQEAQRYNPHNVGFAERAAEADRLAREVSRV